MVLIWEVLIHDLEMKEKRNFVSLTIDEWSSRRLFSMLGVIVNFMDTSGVKLKAELLGIKYLKVHIQENTFLSL